MCYMRNLGHGSLAASERAAGQSEWFEKALPSSPKIRIFIYIWMSYNTILFTKPVSGTCSTKSIALPVVREDVRKHRIKMMVELGHYQEAIEVMTAEKFIPSGNGPEFP